jgi:thiol-disulfide isomerase/thioredoxin
MIPGTPAETGTDQEELMRKLICRGVPFALVAGLVGCAACTSAPPPVGPVEVSEARFADIDKVLKESKGKVVLVDFWATWCGPCKKKFPDFVALHRKYGAKGLACVSISMEKLGPKPGSKDEVLKFLKEQGADFKNLIATDPEGDEKKLEERFGEVAGIPYQVMFDRTGKRIWTSDDDLKLEAKEREERMVKVLEAELAKPAP